MASDKKRGGKGDVKGRTTGKFRCLYCFEHLAPPEGATEFKAVETTELAGCSPLHIPFAAPFFI
ncbi:MAG: hypothetical protein R6V54_04955 [Desulfobacteraceae bacterium]